MMPEMLVLPLYKNVFGHPKWCRIFSINRRSRIDEDYYPGTLMLKKDDQQGSFFWKGFGDKTYKFKAVLDASFRRSRHRRRGLRKEGFLDQSIGLCTRGFFNQKIPRILMFVH